MASEEERARIMAEYLAGADEDDGLGDFDPDDVRNMRIVSTICCIHRAFEVACAANGLDGLRCFTMAAFKMAVSHGSLSYPFSSDHSLCFLLSHHVSSLTSFP